MNNKTQKILTWSIAGILVGFTAISVYKAVKKKSTGLTSDSDKATKLNADMEALLTKIKNTPK